MYPVSYSDPSASLFQYLTPQTRALNTDEHPDDHSERSESQYQGERKFSDISENTSTPSKSKIRKTKKNEELKPLKLIERFDRLNTHLKACDNLTPEECSLNEIKSFVDTFKETDSFEELKRMRKIKERLFLLNKHFKKSEGQNQTQIKTLKAVSDTLKVKMNSLLQAPNVRSHLAFESAIAKKKGAKVRNRIITTRQMREMLKNRLPEYEGSLSDISKVLARQLNEIMEEPGKYKGKNLQLKAGGKEHFFALDDENTEAIALDFFLWIEVSLDGKQIELFIVPQMHTPIGNGANKEAYEAHCLDIPLKTKKTPTELKFPGKPSLFVYDRESIYTPKVLIKLSTKEDQDPLENHKRNQIKREINVHRILQKSISEDLLVAPLKRTTPAVLGTENNELYSQKRYLSDLDDAIKLDKMPLDFSKTPKFKKISTKEFLKVILDVANSLKSFHSNKFIHQDVKPQNIYLETGQDGKTIKGVIADYDLVQDSGIKFFRFLGDNYWYWDSLSNRGLFSSFTDVYGLCKCLVQAIIPGWNKAFENSPLMKEEQESLLLDVIKIMFPKTELPKNASKTEMIQYIEEMLETTIKNEISPRKEKFEEALIKIRAIKNVLTLYAKVISIDQELSQIQFPSEYVWKLIQNDSDYTKKDECLLKEIDVYFNLKGSAFATHIITAIPCYDALTVSSKIQNIRAELELKTKSSSLDPTIKSELARIQKKIDARFCALEFMSYLSRSKKHVKEQQPIYLALINPAILINDKTVFEYINSQTKTIVYSKENKEYLDILKKISEISDPNQKRKTLKKLLTDRINEISPSFERDELKKILRQIFMLEGAMDFAIEVLNGYKIKRSEVEKRAMSMETFIEHLNAIKGTGGENLILC